jgi:signal transduction histidine kinase
MKLLKHLPFFVLLVLVYATSSSQQINKIGIRVKDNGNGAPKSVIDKIFQPFFTTKPTGEGTGLIKPCVRYH